ncbi:MULTISPECIES: ABC transporter ATP-binding protein [unclassified Actinobaculum]|uniref:ABC transporter ATP-binding protein n=1 Tax=unclassified Actinobaculum TaxID=2609299 RepID=UPI00196B911C|nr:MULTISPECIES: ABC transporter ATP-binding protein [unclassified Actinobaculum]
MTDMTDQTDSAQAVSVNGLVKRYGELLAVDGLSLGIAHGEIFGLLGPNGSGKTTTINCILQLLKYDRGEIEVFGRPIRATSYDLKRRIGVVPQEVAVLEELTVRENIDAFCALYVPDRKKRQRLVGEAMDFVGLGKFARFRPKKLSGGLLRRLNIACGIAHRPDLIVLDEPTVAVDPQSRNAILDGIKNLNAQGVTVIYTSHYMEEVEQLCTRIMIMDSGREIASGTNNELKAMIGVGERIRVEVLQPENPRQPTLDAVRRIQHVRTVAWEAPELLIECTNGTHNLADVLGVLSAEGIAYGRITSEPPTLNDVFLELTGRELRDEAA